MGSYALVSVDGQRFRRAVVGRLYTCESRCRKHSRPAAHTHAAIHIVSDHRYSHLPNVSSVTSSNEKLSSEGAKEWRPDFTVRAAKCGMKEATLIIWQVPTPQWRLLVPKLWKHTLDNALYNET